MRRIPFEEPDWTAAPDWAAALGCGRKRHRVPVRSAAGDWRNEVVVGVADRFPKHKLSAPRGETVAHGLDRLGLAQDPARTGAAMNGGKLWRFYENCKAIGYTFALSPAGAVEVTEPATFQNPVMRQEIAQRGRWLRDLVQLDGLLGRPYWRRKW